MASRFVSPRGAEGSAGVRWPVVRGPVRGEGVTRPYSSSIVDLEQYGYVEEEFFVSGTAQMFCAAVGAALDVHGRWRVVGGQESSYVTRILVRRPVASRFNGTVVVEFMQEYFGTERDTNFRWNAETLLREGFAWVGASLHHEGIDERSRTTFTYNGVTRRSGPALVDWDPARYADLKFPDSDLCYDVLSQIGAAVGPSRRAHAVDPLAGLCLERVVAVGNTIAADRLRHYINGIHPLHRVFDGFFLQDLAESGVGLAHDVPSPEGLWLRTDVTEPTIVLNTTTAAVGVQRQPEGANLRFWEPAGSSHTTGQYMRRVAAANSRDLGEDGGDIDDLRDANSFPVQYVSGAAIVAVHRWAADGVAAASFPRISRRGEPPQAAENLDEYGNALEGLRTPWVDVPIARYDWRGDNIGGSGRTYPLDAEALNKLYGTPSVYQDKFEAAANEACQRGVLLEHDTSEAIDIARKVNW